MSMSQSTFMHEGNQQSNAHACLDLIKLVWNNLILYTKDNDATNPNQNKKDEFEIYV